MTSSSVILAGAIIIGNGISFAAIPILSRLYSPESFGIFGFVISWGTIASVVFTLRLESVIPITSSTIQAASLSQHAINRTFLITAVLIFIVLLLWLYGTDFTHEIGVLEVLLGIGTAFSGSYFAVCRSMHQRFDEYRTIASSSIVRSFTFAGLAIVFGFRDFGLLLGSTPLLFASMVAFLIPAILLHCKLEPEMRQAMMPGPARRLKQTDFSDKALNRMITSFVLSQISFQFPLWIAMAFFGSSAAGWMVMGYRLAMFPSDIICGSISLVIARRIADSMFHNRHNIDADKRILALFLLGNFVLFALLGAAVLTLTSYFLGSEWHSAAPVMALLASVGLSFTVQPTAIQIFGLLKRDLEALAVNVVHCVLLSAGAITLWLASGDLYTGVMALALVELIFSIMLSAYMLWAIRKNNNGFAAL